MVRYLGGDRQRWEWCCGNCHGFSQQAKGQEGRNFRVQEARRRKMQNMAYFYESMCSRSEEHTSELQSLMRISYAVFCLKKKKTRKKQNKNRNNTETHSSRKQITKNH